MKEAICFATNNLNKIKEVQSLIGLDFHILSLQDINCHEELAETGNTLDANSWQKASYVYKHYRTNCFADDTGLEVEALNGAPGVYSARYAGEQRDNEANMQLLLKELEGKSNRKAQFRTVITLIINGERFTFEGVAKGIIATQKQGKQGFGYDPLFIPEGFDKSFAEMSMDEKNAISHRGKAVSKLVDFLKNFKF